MHSFAKSNRECHSAKTALQRNAPSERSLSEQRRFKRRLLGVINRRSQASNSTIGLAMLEREKERYLNSPAVQSATLFDLRLRTYKLEDALEAWVQEQQPPIVPRSYKRIPRSIVHWHPKRRQTSGFRKVCKLPLYLKLWHVLARDLIVAQHQPRSHIGDWRDRGRDWQIKALSNVIKGDQQAVVMADINRAFPSVNFDAVYELPYLPEILTRRAIDYRSIDFVGGWKNACPWGVPSAMHDDLETAPSGLLEGSPVSNALFSVMLDDLPDHLDEGILPFVYCDNIVLVASNKEQARKAASALVSYLSGHRFGPFQVTTEVRSVRDGFDHLGYSIYRRGNAVEVALSPRSWDKLVDRLDDRQIKCSVTLRWLHASFGALSYNSMANCVQVILEEEQRRALSSASQAA